MDDFLKLMEQLDHGGALLKFVALGTLLFKLFKFVSSVTTSLEQIQTEQQEAKEERKAQRQLTTDMMLRIVHLEEKYASVTVGSTVVPEATPEREEMQEKASKITGRYPVPKPPKKTS